MSEKKDGKKESDAVDEDGDVEIDYDEKLEKQRKEAELHRLHWEAKQAERQESAHKLTEANSKLVSDLIRMQAEVLKGQREEKERREREEKERAENAISFNNIRNEKEFKRLRALVALIEQNKRDVFMVAVPLLMQSLRAYDADVKGDYEKNTSELNAQLRDKLSKEDADALIKSMAVSERKAKREREGTEGSARASKSSKYASGSSSGYTEAFQSQLLASMQPMYQPVYNPYVYTYPQAASQPFAQPQSVPPAVQQPTQQPMQQGLAAAAMQTAAMIPAPQANLANTPRPFMFNRDPCPFCRVAGHFEADCFKKFPEKAAIFQAWRAANPKQPFRAH